MSIRSDQSFIETFSHINDNFSNADKHRLAKGTNEKYSNTRSIMKEQENKEVDFEPKVLEVAKIGSRSFTLNLTKSKDYENNGVPNEKTQLLPSISTVPIDMIIRLNNLSSNSNSSYLKPEQVCEDGDIHYKFFEETTKEEKGRPPSIP